MAASPLGSLKPDTVVLRHGLRLQGVDDALQRGRGFRRQLRRTGGEVHAREVASPVVVVSSAVAATASPAGRSRPAAVAAGAAAGCDVGAGGGHRQQRHQQQRHDVDDLDQRVDRRAGGVLVGSPTVSPVTAAFVRLGTLAAEVAVLDVLLGVVPGAAAGGHRDGDEEAGHDRADQQAAQRLRPEQQADR